MGQINANTLSIMVLRLFLFSPVVVVLLICSLSPLPALTPVEEAALPKILQKDVLAYRDQRQDEWLGKVTPGQERLFYNEAEWQRTIDRISKLTGQGEVWRNLLFEAADRIVVSPLHVYVASPPGKPDAEGWQRTYGDTLVCLAAAAKIRPEKKYLDKLHEMVLAGCHFDTWGRNGKSGEIVNNDLAAAHMVRGLSIAYDWHRDLFSESEKQLIRTTFQQRVGSILKGVYGTGGIFWTNWYTQNHNHIATASLGLAGMTFLGEIPEASEWLAASVLNYRQVAKAMYADGGIFEGTMYWAYGRSFMLQYIEGTKSVTGVDSFYNDPFMKNAIAFRVGSSVPGFKGVLLWADSRGQDACGPQHILYRLASQYRDGQGQYVADHLPDVPQGGPDTVAWTLLWYDPTVTPEAPTALDYHATSCDIVTTRSGWGDGDYMLSLKAGFNKNFHTKIDAGALSLNLGGQWLLMAPGYGEGALQPGFFEETKKRWSFFSNVTESHSTLLINGQNQRSDIQAVGVIDHYVSSPSLLLTEVDLTNAYQDVQSVRRSVLHRRGDYVLVLDDVKTAAPATVEWLAQVPPGAQLNGQKLTVQGTAGRLSMAMLGDAAPFAERQPTAANVDVSPWWLKTYSSKNSGNEVELAALLQPAFNGEKNSSFQVTARKENEGRHISIEGGAWQDDCWTRIPAAAISSAQDATEDGSVSAEAELLYIRRSGGEVTSWLAGSATKVGSPQVHMQSSDAFDAALESFAKTGAILSLGKSFQGSIVLAEGLSLFDDEGKSVAAGENISLAPGRYYLTGNAGAVDTLRKKSDQLFPGHAAVSNFPVVSLASQPEAPSGRKISWEAETDPRQTDGAASVIPRSEASGKSVLANFGSESPAHSIGWNVDVPESGTYQLTLRCAVGQPKVSFAVLVDGAAPSLDALKAFVLGPPGWGSEKYWELSSFTWKTSVVEDASGNPLELPLTAGKHEIRLASPTSGMNLDFLTLSGADAPASHP